MTTNKETMPRTLSGKVVSNKMDQTIVVKVERQVVHQRVGKYIKLSTKVHAHDPDNKCQIGDVVIVRECRPISKNKRFLLDRVESTS